MTDRPPEVQVRPFQEPDRAEVVRLWTDCGLVRPQNDPDRDIDLKQNFQPDLFLVGTTGGRIAATVMAGYDGHRGWINYLAVAPDLRRQGWGRLILAEAGRRLQDLGCPKINLQVRRSNSEAVEFYRKIGFIEDEVLSLGRRLAPPAADSDL